MGLRLAFALAVIAGVATAAAAQSGKVPQVERPRQEICYDPPPRAACRQRCESSLAQCDAGAPACKEQLARCVAACPPMVCSRGRKQ